MPLGHVVGENVARIRNGQQWTQEEAATRLRAAGLWWRRSQLAVLESGGRDTVGVPELLLLAAGLEVSPADLLDGDGRVSLTKDVSVPRGWLRDVLNGREPSEGLLLSGRAGREQMNLAGGETWSLQADIELAERLAVRPEQVYRAAERLWGRNLHQERERRVAELGELDASQRRAHRGNVTRQLQRELEPYITEEEK